MLHVPRVPCRSPVLVFPALPARQRYFIHRLCEQVQCNTRPQQRSLATVSVGAEPLRRTLVSAVGDGRTSLNAVPDSAVRTARPQVLDKSSSNRSPQLTKEQNSLSVKCTRADDMPGDVETSQQPRHQRRGKMAAEIYKPPAARLNRSQQPPRHGGHPQRVPPPSPPQLQQQQLSTQTAVQRFYRDVEPQLSPQQHHQKLLTGTAVEQYHQAEPQIVPSPPQHFVAQPVQSVSAATAPEPLPSGSPCNKRARDDQSSCLREVALSTVHEPHPADATDKAVGTHTVGGVVPTTVYQSTNSCQSENSSVANDYLRRNSTTPSSENCNNSQNGVTDDVNVSSSCDLRNYLNLKRQMDDLEIKQLSKAVDMLSDKYFNKTAAPYMTSNSKVNLNANDRIFNDTDTFRAFNGSSGDGGQYHRHQGDTNRRPRPDQVLYVPRARRHNDGDAVTADLNHYNNSRGSPLTEHYHNCRPPSPALSITSIVSEFTGRQRYEGRHTGSRPQSRTSIYDGDGVMGNNTAEEEKAPCGRLPQQCCDGRNNSSREFTPGGGNNSDTSNRFNRQTLQLIERCINHGPGRPPSGCSNGADVIHTGNVNDMIDSREFYNSQLSKQPEQHRPDTYGGRASKSPTLNRDFIHSKENVMHPIESSPRRRRSRKNRKRRPQSRDHSVDSISKDRGQGNLAQSGRGGGPVEGNYTYYNSNTSRLDGPASLATSRVGSRNPSLERKVGDWRQLKPISCPTTPARTQQQCLNNYSNKMYSGDCRPNELVDKDVCFTNSVTSSASSTTNSPTEVLTQGSSAMNCRNSADKPPSGRCHMTFQSDSRRHSCNTTSPSSPTHSSSPIPEFSIPTRSDPPSSSSQPRSPSSSAQSNTSCPAPANVFSSTLNTGGVGSPPAALPSPQQPSQSVHHSPEYSPNSNSQVIEIKTSSFVPSCSFPESQNVDARISVDAFLESKDSHDPQQIILAESALQIDAVSNTVTPDEDTSLTAHDFSSYTPMNDSEFDDLCAQYMSLDWAAESEKEELRVSVGADEETSEVTSVASPCKAGEQTHACVTTFEATNYLDESTLREISTAIGREPVIEKTTQDYSKYQRSSPCRSHQVPPSDVYSSPRHNSAVERYSPPHRHNSSSDSRAYSPPSTSGSLPSPIASPPSALSHVLELYDFPSSFRTQDLVQAYQGLQAAAPLDIKWVDDTHALAVFITADIASRALCQPHPHVKARPLSSASLASKNKAARIDEALLPARPRPATSMVLARRLLSGALGVRVTLSREEREREARAIRQAKDRKRRVAKQKQDVWEGNI